MIKKILLAMVIMTNSLAVRAYEKEVIIEWAPFTVLQGVSDAELIAASEQMQKGFLIKQKGYIKRDLLKGKNNNWVDLVYWASAEDAQNAIENAASSPFCMTYFSLMVAVDHNDVGSGVLHFTQMANWK